MHELDLSKIGVVAMRKLTGDGNTLVCLVEKSSSWRESLRREESAVERGALESRLRAVSLTQEELNKSSLCCAPLHAIRAAKIII